MFNMTGGLKYVALSVSDTQKGEKTEDNGAFLRSFSVTFFWLVELFSGA